MIKRFTCLGLLMAVLISLQSPQTSANNLSIQVSDLQFTDANGLLETSETSLKHVYGVKEDELRITLEGTLYGDIPENAQVFATIFSQNQQHLLERDGENFSGEIPLRKTAETQQENLIVTLQSTEKTQGPLATFLQNIQLTSKTKAELVLEISKNILWNIVNIAAALALLMCTWFIATSQTGLQRALVGILWLSLASGIVYNSLGIAVPSMVSNGLLPVRPYTQTTQQPTQLDQPSTSLVIRDQNLELQPGLSRSWSNIRPTVWEFLLKQGEGYPSAQDLVNTLQQKNLRGEIEPTLLQSVKTIVAINNERIQFITEYPDPLLALKMSKIPFSIQNPDEFFQATSSSSTKTVLKRNSTSSTEGFVDEVSILKEISYQPNVDLQKDSAKNGEVDLIKEPAPQLWPQLFQQDFEILPAINTESLMLLTKRSHPLLQNREALSLLRELLHTGAILQTSYFQYGQLAQQFVPPGVTGYSPELNEREPSIYTQQDIGKLIQTIPEKARTLRFEYPESEEKLAKAIISSLEATGLRIESSSYSLKDTIIQASQSQPDIMLIDVNFDLGDVGPFLDTLVDSNSPANVFYRNQQVDELISQSRRELNRFHRLELLQNIMKIIVVEDPIGIPLLFKRSFVATKTYQELTIPEKIIQHFL